MKKLVNSAERAAAAFAAGDYAGAIFFWKFARDFYHLGDFSVQIELARKRLERERKKDPTLRRAPKVRIAAIMDTFTRTNFAPECELLDLLPGEWAAQIEEFNPHFIFIESAWKGLDDAWDHIVSRPRPETGYLIRYCKSAGLPVVFWSKEDPPNYDRFTHVARLAQFIFTTDYDCIPRYRELAGHNRVYLLPFGAQPRYFNPLEKYEREDKFCFAGSWTLKYPQRVEDFEAIVPTLVKERGLDIYARIIIGAECGYPEKYLPNVRGSLPFDEIDRAYKGYKFGINMNSVKNSSTMFARRCFELMACNTVVASNYSRGMKNILGDLVLASDNGGQLVSLLEEYCGDESKLRKFRLAGLREIMLRHTMAQRLDYILRSIGFPWFREPDYVVMFGRASSMEAKNSLIAAFSRQTWEHARLILLQDFEDGETDAANARVCRNPREVWEYLERQGPDTLVGLLNPEDYYGENYITDLVLARLYSDAQALGKAAFFDSRPEGVVLTGDGAQYRPAVDLCASAALVSRPAITREWVLAALRNPSVRTPFGASCLGLDEFSYIRNGAGLEKAAREPAEDMNIPDRGMNMDELLSAPSLYLPTPKKAPAKTPAAPAVYAPLAATHTLVLARYYPAYDDLYRYAFIHARLKGYRKAGIKFDFYSLDEREELTYREFEGANVISGNFKQLRALLRSGQIQTLCVHLLEPRAWEIIEEFVGKIMIILWNHGSEFSTWKSRPYLLKGKSDSERYKAMMRSRQRQELWPRVFSHWQKLRFVFVSNIFMRDCLNDMGLAHNPNCHVIHNYIDGDFFRFTPKKPEDRLNILSIRPYASLKYANDLTARAILHLSKKPFFADLHFSLYGDGPLFDETAEPLREFANVSLNRRFLRQGEIAELHKLHGVFLTPTRDDTQGVSRDEAMASGLVPVTNNVTAIPEFVDEGCACLAPAEDAVALAAQIGKLYENPDLFLRMSNAAARRTRSQCGFDRTIGRELALIQAPLQKNQIKNLERVRVLIYADVNPNIKDGSSQWLANAASIAGRETPAAVLCRENLDPGNVLEEIETGSDAIILEPGDFSLQKLATPFAAAKVISDLCRAFPQINSVIARGYDAEAAILAALPPNVRLFSYISAFVSPGDRNAFDIKEEIKPKLFKILSGSARLLVQTPEIASEMRKFDRSARPITLMPPVMPERLQREVLRTRRDDGIIHIGYAGKVYPKLGIPELIEWSGELRDEGMEILLHIAVSKIYDKPPFNETIRELFNREYVQVHEALSRKETMEMMAGMDYAWCWRDPEGERTVLEISTKLIESAGMGLPCICAPSVVQGRLLGSRYPYFCSGRNDFRALMAKGKSGALDMCPITIKNYFLENISLDLDKAI